MVKKVLGAGSPALSDLPSSPRRINRRLTPTPTCPEFVRAQACRMWARPGAARARRGRARVTRHYPWPSGPARPGGTHAWPPRTDNGVRRHLFWAYDDGSKAEVVEERASLLESPDTAGLRKYHRLVAPELARRSPPHASHVGPR